ncbi:hypothetical protein GGR52DRAFT_554910 [Hypoxylon sp. FL1284]|nr:hypothetical protein GGR52DRAFT_554910 [Hypoxylon sp. FL1284]
MASKIVPPVPPPPAVTTSVRDFSYARLSLLPKPLRRTFPDWYLPRCMYAFFARLVVVMSNVSSKTAVAKTGFIILLMLSSCTSTGFSSIFSSFLR